jgi:hypothetical protein
MVVFLHPVLSSHPISRSRTFLPSSTYRYDSFFSLLLWVFDFSRNRKKLLDCFKFLAPLAWDEASVDSKLK